MSDAEKKFMDLIAELIPEVDGYRAAASRRDTDSKVREFIAVELEGLRGKLGELMAASEEEGEEDMQHDLGLIDSRMGRTVDALRGAEHVEAAFFSDGDVEDGSLATVYDYDRALLEDLVLLRRDVMGMKYETIGNLTLREIEGTLAAIELKVINRKDVLAHCMEA